MKNLKKIGMMLAISACTNLYAITPEGAHDFVDQLVAKAMKVLNNDRVSQAELNQQFGQLLTDNFAIDKIVKHVLGVHFKKLSPDQLAQFTEIYTKRLLKTYADEAKVSKFRGMKPTIDTKVMKLGDSMVVKSTFKNKDGVDSKIDWEIVDANGVKVNDVKIEGISKRQTERSEYNSVFQQNGNDVEKVLNYLEKTVK